MRPLAYPMAQRTRTVCAETNRTSSTTGQHRNELRRLFTCMRVPLLTMAVVTAVGCGQTGQVRMTHYKWKEVQYIRKYRTGDIQTARQSQVDYIHLIEDEERSGLPFKKTAYSKALATARLTLIH